MKQLVSVLRNQQGFIYTGGVEEQKIEEAEEALGLVFSSEYRSYLLAFGSASYYGHELTGISSSSRISVVSVTMAEKEFNESVPAGWYAIERTGLDGIVIWQSGNGWIYQTSPNAEPMQIASSFVEYVTRY